MPLQLPFSVMPMPGHAPPDERFQIIVTATGQVVDDANGYGFRSRESAENRMMFCGGSGIYMKDKALPASAAKPKKPFSPKPMLGCDMANPVYCMVDNATGQVVDDNGGKGYKSAASAAGSWSHKRQQLSRTGSD